MAASRADAAMGSVGRGPLPGRQGLPSGVRRGSLPGRAGAHFRGGQVLPERAGARFWGGLGPASGVGRGSLPPQPARAETLNPLERKGLGRDPWVGPRGAPLLQGAGGRPRGPGRCWADPKRMPALGGRGRRPPGRADGTCPRSPWGPSVTLRCESRVVDGALHNFC